MVVGAGRRCDHGLRRGRAIGVDSRLHLEHYYTNLDHGHDDVTLDVDFDFDFDFDQFNDVIVHDHIRANHDVRFNQHVEFNLEQHWRTDDHYRGYHD